MTIDDHIHTLTIYGASDDLIEVEGTVREEFNGDEGMIATDHGWLVKITYDGTWVIRILAKGQGEYDLVPAEGEDSDNYSDRLTITGPFIDWVLFGTHHARTI